MSHALFLILFVTHVWLIQMRYAYFMSQNVSERIFYESVLPIDHKLSQVRIIDSAGYHLQSILYRVIRGFWFITLIYGGIAFRRDVSWVFRKDQ